MKKDEYVNITNYLNNERNNEIITKNDGGLKMKHLDLFFKLTVKQRKMIYSKGYHTPLWFQIPLKEFRKITKNKRYHATLIDIKRDNIRLVA